MATCEFCDQEMMDASTVTCTVKEVKFPNGETLPGILYNPGPAQRCHDCNITHGGYHHPGCDMERCPRCGGQLISCGCLSVEVGR